jgi:hypothetical protein
VLIPVTDENSSPTATVLLLNFKSHLTELSE